MRETDWTKVLGWPGYRVYRHEINEPAKTLKLWVRRKRGNRKLVCSGCGRKLAEAYDVYEREVRDLPCFEFRTTVVIELYRVRCPDCGVKTEKVPQLPSKAPFSKRFEEAVGLACESAPVRRVARQFALSPNTVRAIDLRYLKRWAPRRRKPALRQMGIDEMYLDEAAKQFQSEMELNAQHSQSLYQLAYIRLQQHQAPEASRLLAQVIKQDPSNSDAHYQLGKALLEQGDVSEATRELETSVQLRPTDYGYFQLSNAYARTGRSDDASRALEKFEKLKPKNAAVP